MSWAHPADWRRSKSSGIWPSGDADAAPPGRHLLTDAIVIGAGFAGLTAAHRLTAAGLDVVVLEARRRVGGRVWTRTLDNGATAELGGEWIASDHDAIARLTAELDLELIGAGIDFGFRQPTDGDGLSRGAHERVVAAIQEALSQLSELDRAKLTAGEFLSRIAPRSPALATLRMRINGSAAVPLSDVGVDEIVGGFGVGARGGCRVALGNQAIASRLAERLADVRLGAPVTSIDTGTTRPRVTIDGSSRFSADCVILAVPLPVLAEFVLPAPLAGVVAAIGYGAAAKLAVATATQPPLLARQDLDQPAWYWTGYGAAGVRSCVTSFVGSARGVDAVVATWQERLVKAVPDIEIIGPPMVVDWGAEKWSRGCYSALRPGHRRMLDAFARPWGRLIVAGEHVFAAGSMNGAVASGERAAALALGLLGGHSERGALGTLPGAEGTSDEAD